MSKPPLPGDFFLVPMAGRIGFLIRVGQWLNGDGWRKVQHAGIYIGCNETIEAMPGGAIRGDIRRYRPEDIVWSSGTRYSYMADGSIGRGMVDELSKVEQGTIALTAIKYEGTPYSFLDYLGLALARFRLRPRWLKAYIASTGHMICSQLVDQCYLEAGVHLFKDGRLPGDVTPADLYNVLQELNHDGDAVDRGTEVH